MTRAVVGILLVVLILPGCAGRIDPATLEGHSPSRILLTILIGRFDDDVERAVDRAVEDWNTVSQLAFDPASRETFFYRGFTRQLGRVLGLPPVDSPYAARQKLSEHYRQFWSTPRS